jgi:hypothetical protein
LTRKQTRQKWPCFLFHQTTVAYLRHPRGNIFPPLIPHFQKMPVFQGFFRLASSLLNAAWETMQ